MAEPPPPRYRVVEEGRRLVVIDRWAKEGRPQSVTLSPASAPNPAGSLLGGPRQIRFDGGAELTTHPFYDDKAPRLIRLDAGSAGLTKAARWIALPIGVGIVLIAIFSTWLLIPLAFVAFQARGKVRAAITRWLDTVEREAS